MHRGDIGDVVDEYAMNLGLQSVTHAYRRDVSAYHAPISFPPSVLSLLDKTLPQTIYHIRIHP